MPREVIKLSFHHQLIQDGIVWIEMLEERNIMAYVYQDIAAQKAISNIKNRYTNAIFQLYQFLNTKI